MKRRKPEEIVSLLREAESSQEPLLDFCRRKGISDKTYYRWRRQYGHLQLDEAKRLKSLEAENAKLKKLVAEILLANEGLKEILEKKG
jgi:putative transposase